MLKKLIKYDFNWINKTMYIYFAILFTSTIFVKIIESQKQTLFITILDKIASGIFIGCMVATFITCLMRIWTRFIENTYKDESYLTHTLPVTKNQIYNSKIITSIISLILTLIIILICIIIVDSNAITIEQLKALYQTLVKTYNEFTAICFVIGIISLIILETICLMMSGIFGIIIGHQSNNHKIIKSIAIGIISYSLLSIISIAIIGLISNPNQIEITEIGLPILNDLKIMGITSIILYIIYNLAYYFIGKKILNKGVNID